ncbi:putative toxin-antitoxin system toxin component, PIN family [Candidatus Latescibacterota bacterium]
MRIVLDTNVLMSGIFFTGPPYEILQLWKAKKIKIVISPDIYSEYVRVAEIISQKYQEIDITGILNLIAVHSEIVQSAQLHEQVCEDPDDDKFIACALAGKVDFIVSGDKHLLDVSGYKGIRILKPKAFYNEFF